MPVVLNKSQCDWKELEGAALVDRTTIFGNPFIKGPDGNRDDVCDKYDEWIWLPKQRLLRRKMKKELKGLDLICHCEPLRCHARTILEIANSNKKGPSRLGRNR